MERDPTYIAATTRRLRHWRGISQEALGALAHLSTRAVQKVESGRHLPTEDTLGRIARALGGDIRIFTKSSPEEDARLYAEIRRTMETTVAVPTTIVRSASDILPAIGTWDMMHTDVGGVGEDALALAAELIDDLTDCMNIGSELTLRERVSEARRLAARCSDLEDLGYRCHVGQHRQVQRAPGGSPLIRDVGLVSVRPKAHGEEPRYAMVRVGPPWELHPDDQPKGTLWDELDAVTRGEDVGAVAGTGAKTRPTD